MRTGVFLDRDETIIRDVPYISDPDKVELLPFAAEGLRMLNERNIPAIVITNQSGIARGFFDHEAFYAVNKRLEDILKANGARIDATYFCPHYPEGPVREFVSVCDCRKPEPGLLLRAAKDLSLDLKKSFFIGDRECDMEVIRRVGGRGVLVGRRRGTVDSDHEAENLLDAVVWIMKEMKNENPE